MPTMQTANLPDDQRQRLHADFLANEQAYWQMRDGLLPAYGGQWVAVDAGKVVAASSDLLALTDAAAAAGGHPYIALVGAEDDVVFRVRKAIFSYDQAYRPFPLPRVAATYWNHAGTHSQTHSDVIPDKGAVLSVLPDGNQQRLLFDGPAGQIVVDP